MSVVPFQGATLFFCATGNKGEVGVLSNLLHFTDSLPASNTQNSLSIPSTQKSTPSLYILH
ncbi:hypothetical protein HQ36_01670 [Porphyromonas gingivicanis]|uniref:Uncharacterized protein n=1 Tax=Porphyromonas gingivicanis TaxID=266762 RepID=A0A0A2G9T1_9PORP|nr:hypothetical protein HQ36_01670 [Porphyromonas gingivicanis]